MMGEKEEKIFTQPLQKESEWEKMTHKDWFPVVGGGPECENCGAHGYEKYDICPVAVDEAIATAVSNREKEIAEEVDKKKEKLPYTPRYCQSRNGIYYCGTCEQAWETCSCSARNTGYKRAIDEVLSILKH